MITEEQSCEMVSKIKGVILEMLEKYDGKFHYAFFIFEEVDDGNIALTSHSYLDEGSVSVLMSEVTKEMEMFQRALEKEEGV